MPIRLKVGRRVDKPGAVYELRGRHSKRHIGPNSATGLATHLEATAADDLVPGDGPVGPDLLDRPSEGVGAVIVDGAYDASIVRRETHSRQGYRNRVGAARPTGCDLQ